MEAPKEHTYVDRKTGRKFKWEVRVVAVAIDNLPPIVCPTCNGARTVGGGPMSFDDPTDCPTCFGRGSLLHPDLPRPPAEMVDYLVKAQREYVDSGGFDGSTPDPVSDRSVVPLKLQGSSGGLGYPCPPTLGQNLPD